MRCFFFLSFLLLFSQGIYAQSITGTYHSKQFSLFARGFAQVFGNTLYAIGSTLEINPDATFHLINCGNIEDGYWHVNGHQLILTVTANRFRIDSLNRTGYKGMFPENMIPAVPVIYEIKKHGLKHKTKLKDSNRYLVEYLVKTRAGKK